MYKVFKFDSMKTVFPTTAQPVASFQRLDHAIEYAENHFDQNVQYITAFSDQDANGVRILYFPANSAESSKLEPFDKIVPFWEGGQACK